MSWTIKSSALQALARRGHHGDDADDAGLTEVSDTRGDPGPFDKLRERGQG
jgi:hypothetical protein